MEYIKFIEEYRAGLLENVHFGSLCGINEKKEIVYQLGEKDVPIFFRSASKPFQAIPIFLTDYMDKYHLTDKERALFIASQRGEQYHQDTLHTLLEKLPVNESDLVCAPSYPLNEEPKIAYVQAGKKKRKLLHNCAGKHIGFIAACHANNYPIDGYHLPDHPLQIQIKEIIAYLSEMDTKDIPVGIDGCGVPVFAIPLKRMAIAYSKLANPCLIEDANLRSAVEKLTAVMTKENEMIASHNFICTALLQDSNIIAKGGAQGVYCFALKKEGISFALKVVNGSEDPWPNIIASILEQIDYANKETIERIKTLRPPIVKNDAGLEVGTIKSCFHLA